MILDETDVLFHLFNSEEYTRKVLPYLTEHYFSVSINKQIFKTFHDYYTKYNSLPSKNQIHLEIVNKSDVKQTIVDQLSESLNDLVGETDIEMKWLVDKSEQFIKDKAIYNALLESIAIVDKKSKKSKDSIPELLSKALSVSFDHHIGHDYFNDASERFDFYNLVVDRVKFDMDVLNKITHGGLPKKTLNVFASATGVGKSLVMCHLASFYLSQGHNVLYITLEMAEERIAERIDVNLLDISLNDISGSSKDHYMKLINEQWKKTKGKLVIKEYPTSGANVEHFKSLLRELKIKKNFVPTILFIDYLTICSSARYKPGADVNSYFIGKAIAEEMRGLAVEYELICISAVQFNRSGYNNSDSDITNISESAAIAMTADTLFGLISTEDLRKENRILVKQMKNRLGDLNYYSKFLIGVDYAKMRIYELDGTKEIEDDEKQDEQCYVAVSSSSTKKKIQEEEESSIINTKSSLKDKVRSVNWG